MTKLPGIRNARVRGFTFVEVLTVTALLSILVLLAMPVYKNQVRRTRERELREDLRSIRTAIDEYHKIAVLQPPQFTIEHCAECYGYPPDLKTLVEGVEAADASGKKRKFLRAIPNDPMNATESEWDEGGWKLRSFQDDWDSSSWWRENVFDVRSASEGKALDGTFYKDW